MSRIGKAPITVPAGVDVKVDGRTISVKGPKGTLEREIPGTITITLTDGTATRSCVNARTTRTRPRPCTGSPVAW